MRTTFLALLLCSLPALAHAQSTAIRVTGAVPQPLTLTKEDLAKMPRTQAKTLVRGEQSVFEGIALRELLTRAGVPVGEALRGAELAKAVIVTGADGYRVAFGIAELDPGFTDRIVILADQRDGMTLAGNTGPFQLVVTDEKRPGRWVRQVVSIEVMDSQPH